ncbi:MAG: hypothetical protein KAT17_01085, partial [Candidatus Aminicenantes bacterium]|nr:hypothetical protein [Candidatus Aminicenantes bacterium]
TKERTKNYFVLVNGEVNTVLVKGMIYHKPGPVSLAKKQPDSTFEIPSIKKIEKPIQKKKRKTSEIKIEDESLKQQELKKLLNGAAVYCDKLKKAAFHYICKEKVVETIDKRGSGQNSLSPENAAAFSDPQWRLYYANQISVQNISNQNKKEIYKYLFDYQMIKDKGKISEQRKYLKGKNEKLGKAIADYRIRSFLAQKAIFAPATLLDKNRQYKYHFNFIGYKKQKKHTFAIIEARPKNPEDAHYIYGKIWIDINDYSIKKILVNPGAIRGYEKLLEFSKKLQTRLFLDCEIDFDETYQGMRFPSRIVLSEKYKGGPVFRREWERCKTVYKYQDYQFFKVQTEEIIK